MCNKGLSMRFHEAWDKVQNDYYQKLELAKTKDEQDKLFLEYITKSGAYSRLAKLRTDRIFAKTNDGMNEKVCEIEEEIIDIRECYSADEIYFEVEFDGFFIEIEKSEIEKYNLYDKDKLKIAIVIAYLHSEE